MTRFFELSLLMLLLVCLSGAVGDELEDYLADLLLQGVDLPPKHDGYLTVMSRNQFQEEFDMTADGPPKVIKVMFDGKVQRIVTVLPMEISDGSVVPIPFIIDSGAPGLMFLGSGSVNRLEQLNLINNRKRTNVNRKIFHLMGTFRNEARNLSLVQPNAMEFPKKKEWMSIEGDIRLNLIGLHAMAALNIDIIWDQIFSVG